MAFRAVVDVSRLDGSNGFQITGESSDDFSGSSVASAGDINGDGFADLILGAPLAAYDTGAAYVVFGRSGGFAAIEGLAFLDGTNGFRLEGAERFSLAGEVSSAGDVNGDGFNDVIVGASNADFDYSSPYGSGASYVVFGKAGGFNYDVDLGALNGADGFRITGELPGDSSGVSVASAGDVNGDGLDDVIVGAFRANPNGNDSGASYVVFGRAGEFAPDLRLRSLDGSNGFQISGESSRDESGRSVAGAGDINGDGFDDVIVGAPNADPFGNAYVVFGRAGGFGAELDLFALDGANGFRISGEARYSAQSVASAGDINGDGFDDVIVGASSADPNGIQDQDAGASYVVFGKARGFGADLSLSTLNGTNGFQISGEAAGDRSGFSVASAGDVNGDGFGDLIIGAPEANTDAYDQSGSSYVVFGKADGFAAQINLAALDGRNGFEINGALGGSRSGSSVSSAGDLNGDGFDDVVVGAPSAVSDRGFSYVIFGQATGAIQRTGTDAGEVLGGSGFADLLDGAGGDDTVSGAGGNDRLFGGTGDDQVVGGAGDDRLSGSGGADGLFGGVGADSLTGGGGSDRLFGGLGADALAGGVGADTFAFNAVAESSPFGFDTIADFAREQDRIDLRPIDADPDAAGNQAFSFLNRATFTGVGGEVRFGFANGDTLVLADLDGDRRADLQVVLEGTTTLAASDFLL